MNTEGPARWPPKFMAGDSHEVALYKRWINKENALAQAAQRRDIPYDHRQSLQSTMSHKYLAPDPTYAAGSGHLRGRPRHEWARFAGATGYDPVVGYNARWAERRTRTSTPFTLYRSQSSSSLAMSTALEPLNIKPVERRSMPRRPEVQTPPQMYKSTSLLDLAGDGDAYGLSAGKGRTEFGNDNGSAMQSLAFSQPN